MRCGELVTAEGLPTRWGHEPAGAGRTRGYSAGKPRCELNPGNTVSDEALFADLGGFGTNNRCVEAHRGQEGERQAARICMWAMTAGPHPGQRGRDRGGEPGRNPSSLRVEVATAWRPACGRNWRMNSPAIRVMRRLRRVRDESLQWKATSPLSTDSRRNSKMTGGIHH